MILMASTVLGVRPLFRVGDASTDQDIFSKQRESSVSSIDAPKKKRPLRSKLHASQDMTLSRPTQIHDSPPTPTTYIPTLLTTTPSSQHGLDSCNALGLTGVPAVPPQANIELNIFDTSFPYSLPSSLEPASWYANMTTWSNATYGCHSDAPDLSTQYDWSSFAFLDSMPVSYDQPPFTTDVESDASSLPSSSSSSSEGLSRSSSAEPYYETYEHLGDFGSYMYDMSGDGSSLLGKMSFQ